MSLLEPGPDSANRSKSRAAEATVALMAAAGAKGSFAGAGTLSSSGRKALETAAYNGGELRQVLARPQPRPLTGPPMTCQHQAREAAGFCSRRRVLKLRPAASSAAERPHAAVSARVGRGWS